MITLQKAMKLNGIEDWTLTPSEKRFLLTATKDLLKNHDEKWFQENQPRLQKELKIAFQF